MNQEVPKVTIDDLCLYVTSGGTPSRKNEEFWKNGDIDWFKTGELNDWYVFNSEEKINDKGLKGSSAKLFPENTVLMAMYGDGKTITTLGLLKTPASTNQACCAMIVDPDKCDHLYLLYALKYHRRELLKLVVAGAQRNLSNGIIKKFSINYFLIGQQKQIAKILSNYDELIENNRRRILLLEEFARLFYKEWFVRLRFPGHEHVKIIDGVPEGWKKGIISDFFDTTSGGTPSRKMPEYYEGDINWVKTKELDERYIFKTEEKITEEAVKKSSAKVFPAESLLVSIYGGTNIGRTGILDRPSASNQACVVLLPKRKIEDYMFMQQWFKYNRAYLIGLSQGAAQTNISQQTLKSLELLWPKAELIDLFTEDMRPIYRQIRNLGLQISQLEQARDYLLPRLMNGELTA